MTLLPKKFELLRNYTKEFFILENEFRTKCNCLSVGEELDESVFQTECFLKLQCLFEIFKSMLTIANEHLLQVLVSDRFVNTTIGIFECI